MSIESQSGLGSDIRGEGPSEYTLENLQAEPERRCEIADDAREQLERWGMSGEQVEALAQLASAYEYANCLEKIEEIVQRGGIITRGDRGEAVLLPDFIDLEDRSNGQCGEIAAKVIRDMHNTGWLSDVNKANKAADKEELYAYWVVGNSRTHFTTEKEIHVWVGLGPRNCAPEDMVVVDGSFLEISKQGSNGYTSNIAERNPSSKWMRPDVLMPLGELDYNEESSREGTRSSIVVGVTDNRAFVVMLGFVIDRATETGVIRPVIRLKGADGKSTASCVRLGESGIEWFDADMVDEQTRAEAENMLVAAEGMKFTEDKDAGWASRHKWAEAKFR